MLDGEIVSESLRDLPKITQAYISQRKPLHTTCMPQAFIQPF